jgi:hypothetical protein
MVLPLSDLSFVHFGTAPTFLKWKVRFQLSQCLQMTQNTMVVVSKFPPMSAQLLAGTKKQQKELPQSTLDAHFTSKSGANKIARVESIHNGRVRSIQCGYCGNSFAPQGIAAHEAKHAIQDDKRNPTHAMRFGKVKVRADVSAKPPTAPDTGPTDSLLHPQVEVVDCTMDDEDEPMELEENESENFVMIVDENGNSHDDVCQESGSIAVINQSSRVTNLLNEHRIEILDYLHARKKDSEFPKTATVKWVQSQAHFNRPKFDR